MKCWNGWGDEAITYPLPTSAARYLEAEKGSLGMRALGTICKLYDPDGIMNPGKSVIEESTLHSSLFTAKSAKDAKN